MDHGTQEDLEHQVFFELERDFRGGGFDPADEVGVGGRWTDKQFLCVRGREDEGRGEGGLRWETEQKGRGGALQTTADYRR